ncbi:MAG: hypothetical protein MI922_30310 [Bacteroidales bacterium]|nr:hypothetical protein [Bacteroidales bacterium]
MNRVTLFLTNLVVLALFLTSCDSTIEPAEKYMTVNGKKIELEKAYIYDWGTNSDITYREYEITFETEGTYPSDYLEIDFFSSSTTRLNEGTYTYKEYYYAGGNLSNIYVGLNLQYDDKGEAVSGTRFSDWDTDFTGTVTISKKNDNYMFEFDLETEYDGQEYKITGVYNDVLKEN